MTKNKTSFSTRRIGGKILLICVGIGLVTAVIVTIVSIVIASNALRKNSFNQLQSVQQIKKSQIESFFNERMGDISVLSKNSTVMESIHAFEEAFDADGKRTDGPNWLAAEKKYAPWLVQYEKEYGYYDLFLIHYDGEVIYTVAKESDLGANLATSALRDSPLGKMFQKVKSGSSYLQDFEPYAPSGGKPAAFVGAPIMENGKFIGVVALQIPLKSINKIMQERSGMGETGETYLVGSDLLMRSDSFLDPEGHSVNASFAGTIKDNGVDTEATREAFKGKSDAKIITDYNGNPVLSAYSQLKAQGLNWAILAEIDKAEVDKPVQRLIWIIIGITALVVVAVIIVSIFFSKSLSDPIQVISTLMGSLAKGDLKVSIDDKLQQRVDEIGDMSKNAKQLIIQMSETIGNIISSSEQVAAASDQIAKGNQDLSSRTELQASALEETSSSMEEMAASIKTNSDNSIQANQLAKDTDTKANQGSDSMTEMINAMREISDSSKKIADIIQVMNDIAFQTNLLALNASIEAARAGEQGRGFAVVAVEVRKLAQRSDEAAKEIANLIKDSNVKVDTGSDLASKAGEALTEITGSVNKVSNLIAEVTAASQEQLSSVEEVNKALSNLDQNTQQNASLVEESASAAEELSAQAQELNAAVNYFKIDDTLRGNGNKRLTTDTKIHQFALDVKADKSKKMIEKSESPQSQKKEYKKNVATKTITAKDNDKDDEFEEF